MSRSFGFAPPEPRAAALVRPRSLRLLLAQWKRWVTVVVGGPGLGKTMLVAQAENRLAPCGDDAWVELEPADIDAGSLAAAAARALSLPLARLGGLGAVERLRENELRLSPAELQRFASRRGVRPEDLAISGGWLAMAELAATAGVPPVAEGTTQQRLHRCGLNEPSTSSRRRPA